MPQSSTSTVYTSHSQSARSVLAQSLQEALAIVDDSCQIRENHMSGRIAELRFENMMGASENTLMSAKSVFVLVNGSSVNRAVDAVWSPLWLERHIAYETDNLETARELEALSDYDLVITVNTNSFLAFGSSNCTWVATAQGNADYYSATTIFLHEILHGMGIYSVLAQVSGSAADPSLLGHVTTYDAMLSDQSGNRIINTEVSASDISISSLAGKALFVEAQAVYNPADFVGGSSLSHLSGQGSLMQPYAPNSTCSFRLGKPEVEVLNALGWNCSSNHTHEWSTEPKFIAPSLQALDDHNGGSNHLGYHHHDLQDDREVGSWLAFIMLICLIIGIAICVFSASTSTKDYPQCCSCCGCCTKKPVHVVEPTASSVLFMGYEA